MSAADRREQLLDAAAALAADEGFQAVSIDSVARDAGVARTLLYKHFANRTELLAAVVEREMDRAVAQVSETILEELTEGSAVELMIESLSSYLRVVKTHPTTWRLVLTPPEGAPPKMRDRINAGRAQVLERMVVALRPALEAEADPPDAELTARLLSVIADEYARMLLADPARFPANRLLEHARWVLEHTRPDVRSSTVNTKE